MQGINVDTASKPDLRAALKASLDEIDELRRSVSRLIRQSAIPTVVHHVSHVEDSVPAGWSERNGIEIPRADGVFESATAWVRIKHGIIVGAGLRNQSILHLAISLELLDQGAEHHGNLYRDWRAAFLSQLDPEKSGGKGTDNPAAWSKEDRYSKLLRRTDQDFLSAMDCIVAIRPKARHLAAFQHNQKGFIDAFKTVGKAMNEINREADDALNKTLDHPS